MGCPLLAARYRRLDGDAPAAAVRSGGAERAPAAEAAVKGGLRAAAKAASAASRNQTRIHTFWSLRRQALRLRSNP